MEPKAGDRVSLDSKKVGQPRRSGVVTKVNKGLSGLRYQIRWDDGNESVIAPGAGILQVEGANSKSPGRTKAKAAKPKAAKPKAAKPKAAKPKAKAKSGGKKPAKRRGR